MQSACTISMCLTQKQFLSEKALQNDGTFYYGTLLSRSLK